LVPIRVGADYAGADGDASEVGEQGSYLRFDRLIYSAAGGGASADVGWPGSLGDVRGEGRCEICQGGEPGGDLIAIGEVRMPNLYHPVLVLERVEANEASLIPSPVPA
jgi:hypothetical protein